MPRAGLLILYLWFRHFNSSPAHFLLLWNLFFFFLYSLFSCCYWTHEQTAAERFWIGLGGLSASPVGIELDGEATEMERGQGAMEKRNNYFTSSSSSTKTAFLSADVVFLLDGLRCRALWPELGAKFFFPCCLYECVWLSSGSLIYWADISQTEDWPPRRFFSFSFSLSRGRTGPVNKSLHSLPLQSLLHESHYTHIRFTLSGGWIHMAESTKKSWSGQLKKTISRAAQSAFVATFAHHAPASSSSQRQHHNWISNSNLFFLRLGL